MTEQPKIECAYDALVDTAALIPNPRNPNTHPRRQIELLAKIIQYQGWRNPIVVSNRSGYIIKGHARLEAALLLGCEKCPVDYQDYANEAAEWADMIADNRLAELAECDQPMLKDILQELDNGTFDMELTGFDAESIEDLMTQLHETEEGLTDEDAIPENVETRCKKGDLWKLGVHRLLCGDSIVLADVERLMNGEKADMVFTDPPYNVKWEYRGKLHGERFEGICNDNLKPEEWDAFCIGFTSNLAAVLKEGHAYYICSGWASFSQFEQCLKKTRMEFRQLIVWAKNQFVMGKFKTDYHRQHEQVLYGWREGAAHVWYGGHAESDLWCVDKVHNTAMVHSTEKPVALSSRAINNSSQLNDIVLDIFSGSGSTLIACEKLGRKCYSMEIDPHYCDVIIKRWEDFTGNQAELINTH